MTIILLPCDGCHNRNQILSTEMENGVERGPWAVPSRSQCVVGTQNEKAKPVCCPISVIRCPMSVLVIWFSETKQL